MSASFDLARWLHGGLLIGKACAALRGPRWKGLWLHVCLWQGSHRWTGWNPRRSLQRIAAGGMQRESWPGRGSPPGRFHPGAVLQACSSSAGTPAARGHPTRSESLSTLARPKPLSSLRLSESREERTCGCSTRYWLPRASIFATLPATGLNSLPDGDPRRQGCQPVVARDCDSVGSQRLLLLSLLCKPVAYLDVT